MSKDREGCNLQQCVWMSMTKIHLFYFILSYNIRSKKLRNACTLTAIVHEQLEMAVTTVVSGRAAILVGSLCGKLWLPLLKTILHVASWTSLASLDLLYLDLLLPPLPRPLQGGLLAVKLAMEFSLD